MQRYIRYSELIARGIVNNRQTLHRWMQDLGFPAPIVLGPRTRVWAEDSVDAWIESRRAFKASTVPGRRDDGVRP
jgi:predicted DNA-binding transcriptional regulator AlpA